MNIVFFEMATRLVIADNKSGKIWAISLPPFKINLLIKSPKKIEALSDWDGSNILAINSTIKTIPFLPVFGSTLLYIYYKKTFIILIILN